ncbi:unnamed protein product [Rotaria sordida]|uniref:Uncharacterized protein n=1 Tax=Rotaria sordida TaxID=392033 RepID=A0A819D9K4_9BILA|nr:unnamed protein product [Rotaria sordida]
MAIIIGNSKTQYAMNIQGDDKDIKINIGDTAIKASTDTAAQEMDINEDIQELEEEEEENISPIIQIFECLTFERGHQIHDQVTSMIDLFSLSNLFYEKLNKQHFEAER